MAVLLECANCYQNYPAPKGDSRSAVCPWCGAAGDVDLTPFSANGFPHLSPSRFPRRRRTLPALAWLVIGVGLGACVVLTVFVLWSPNSSAVVRGSPDPAHGSDRRSLSRTQGPGDLRSRKWHGRETVPQPKHTVPQPSQNVPPPSVELVRKLVREELNRSGAPEPREPPKATTNRWLSNRPPPIGDPNDDSPPLGLTLRERMPERIGSPPSSLDTDKHASPPAKTPPPARPQDDPAAVAALVVAGIRCDKDADTGIVTRVDGSFRMTDALMPHVGKLPGLVELKLSFADVTDAGLAHVKDLTDIQELFLNQTKVTDAGLAHLEKLIKLEKLDLEKTLVTDASLKLLPSLKRLRHVDLRGTKVTPPGVEGLKETFPAAKIRF